MKSKQILDARIAVDVGIIVKDMTTALAFYADLLGLDIITELKTSLIAKGRMIQLKHGSSLIKLVELERPPKTTNPKGLTQTFGHRYITLVVKDIKPILEKLERANTEIFVPLTELSNGTLIAMVFDPDGNSVELVQETT